MYKKQNNGGFNNAKKVVATFGVLGMLVVGLGVISMTQMATEQKVETAVDASYFSCQEYQLTTIYYRGNQGFARNTPIVNGTEQWSQSEPFRMVVNLNENPRVLPGDGEVRGIDIQIYPSGTSAKFQLVRGDTGYFKKLSNSVLGQIDWAQEMKTNWRESGTGYGGWQAFNTVATVKDEGATKTEYYYRSLYIDNKGYVGVGFYKYDSKTWRVIEENNTNSLLGLNSKKLVVNLSENPTALPGSGPIQAIGDYVSQNNTVLNQSWFRGNVQYGRQVPIRDYKPDYSSATPIKADIDLNANPTALPGQGNMQAITRFINCKR